MSSLGRLVFAGTGAFGVPLLARLVEMGERPLVISQPDRPAGRGLKPRPSPIATLARERGLQVETPRRLRSDEARHLLEAYDPDGLLLAAYGQLVPSHVLAMGRRPALNVHPSLLPRHRGAAPVASTILAGDDVAGLTLMVMTDELDAGPIVAQWPMPLTGRESAPELETRLAELAAEVVPERLRAWPASAEDATPQDPAAATMIRPFHRADGWIDWRRPAEVIDRQVRALQPWPGAWTTIDGERLHVRAARPVAGVSGVPIGSLLPGEWPEVACGEGALLLEAVQPAGRPTMAADAWRRGLQRDHVLLGAAPPPDPAAAPASA
jgi:methionyl-tRNA formyltransferase